MESFQTVNFVRLSAILAITFVSISANAKQSTTIDKQYKNHMMGAFLGYTYAHDETEFTYGIEYEFRFHQNWGVGLVYERVDDAHHGDGIDIKVAELYYHLDEHWRFGAGFGEEQIKGHHGHKEDLIRITACYDIHFDNFGVAPIYSIDFIDGEDVHVLGVAFIFQF
jgi:hypothetical protein